MKNEYKDLKDILQKMLQECCRNADCATIEKIFTAAEWTWMDHITDEHYTPTEHEIRTELYRLGKSILESLMKDYEGDADWGKEIPKPYTTMSGRLFFTIDWEGHDEEFDIIRDIAMSCGINHEFSMSYLDKIGQNVFSVNTYYIDDEREVRRIFDRKEIL